eukprot:6451477-Karenia_brevis.AAC.1
MVGEWGANWSCLPNGSPGNFSSCASNGHCHPGVAATLCDSGVLKELCQCRCQLRTCAERASALASQG